jgi:hypothetical protein
LAPESGLNPLRQPDRRKTNGRLSRQKGTVVKTSIRLALTSLAVSCITLAASGAPLSFLGHAKDAGVRQVMLLAPEGLDGQGLAPSRPGDPAIHALSTSTRQ